MLKVLKYSFYDLIRSRWAFIYMAFYLVLTVSLLLISGNVSKVTISLMNIILMLVPLIASMFGIMYYYNSREFTELLLAQPIQRTAIFFGQYLGIALSLSLSLIIGIGAPFLIYGFFETGDLQNISMLLIVGIFLSFIFSGIAYFIGLCHENRIKGFGLSILSWLFFAVIYDGLFLLILATFNEYPLENFAIGASMFNPIDLSRILILLKLDISALMGYTGAVFNHFLGNATGMTTAFMVLTAWVIVPAWGLGLVAKRKDF